MKSGIYAKSGIYTQKKTEFAQKAESAQESGICTKSEICGICTNDETSELWEFAFQALHHAYLASYSTSSLVEP